MKFTEKIERFRKEASEAKSANNIIDMLKKLKDNNDQNTSYRWIWELIQNAKDVVNSSGKVDIAINFSETTKTLEFSHNGRLFTTENIIFLIEQVSTKDRSLNEKNRRKTTGKFGTGFLTTHLLSEKVRVLGYLQDADETPYSFETLLDRTGADKSAIKAAIENSYEMFNGGKESVVVENDFNTKFIYDLDEKGLAIALDVLRDLLVSISYVLAFVPELNSISVIAEQIGKEDFNWAICRGENRPVELSNATVTEVQITRSKNGKPNTTSRYVFVLSNEHISIATEIVTNEHEKHIVEYKEKLPKIFCDFPLLGTNDFSLPVVVNSSMFNPTELRDGIPLVCSGRASDDSKENIERITQAAELFKTMLDYFVEKDYKEIYNLVNQAYKRIYYLRRKLCTFKTI